MNIYICIVFWIINSLVRHCRSEFFDSRNNAIKSTFSEDFLFGVGTAAIQTEGAWNDDGKGWSMWDHLVRTNPDAIADKSNADVTCNSYYMYKRDVQMLKELGVNAYRFSISWPRILPYGRPDYVNPLGIAHYNDLIDELVANDIVPFVTIYHWDLPQNLNEQNGWLNEEIVDWFGNYARVLFQNFGDRVKHWLTINEPNIHCRFGYGLGVHPPRVRSPETGPYNCGRNILLANARAYHIYDGEFRQSQNGQIGLVFNMDWPIPASNSQNDTDAVKDYKDFTLGQYAHPIFSKEGNYPQGFIDRVAAISSSQGYSTSRLQPLTQEQIDYIKGTSDFFAINHYSNEYIYRNDSIIDLYDIPSLENDANYGTFRGPQDTIDHSSAMTWEYAPGFYNVLQYIRETYNNPDIYVTENGLADDKGLIDIDKVNYYRNYLTAMLAAKIDGVNVKGYFAWNLMDDFVWNFGYQLKFGFYQVDMEDPERKRTPRMSACVYKEIIRSREIDYNYDTYPCISGSYSVSPSIIIIVLKCIILYFI